MKFLSAISIVFSFLIVLLIGSQSKILFILLGQGHFVMAYIYMFKAGKIDSKFFIKYGIISFFLSLVYFTGILSTSLLTTITALYFVIHFVLDLYFVNGRVVNYKEVFLSTLPLMTVYFVLISNYMGLGLEKYISILYPISFLGFLYKWKENWFYKVTSAIFSLIIFISVLISYSAFRSNIMPLIIIGHYIMWYLLYFYKKRKDYVFLKSYVAYIVFVNGVLAMLFFCYVTYGFEIGVFLFREDVFYLWTLMHYFSTFRIDNFLTKPKLVN